jgi:hypothetical protein
MAGGLVIGCFEPVRVLISGCLGRLVDARGPYRPPKKVEWGPLRGRNLPRTPARPPVGVPIIALAFAFLINCANTPMGECDRP